MSAIAAANTQPAKEMSARSPGVKCSARNWDVGWSVPGWQPAHRLMSGGSAARVPQPPQLRQTVPSLDVIRAAFDTVGILTLSISRESGWEAGAGRLGQEEGP